MATVDAMGVIMHVTDALPGGQEPEDMVGTLVWEIAKTPADKAKILDHFAVCLLLGEPQVFRVAESGGNCAVEFRFDKVPCEKLTGRAAVVFRACRVHLPPKLSARELSILMFAADGCDSNHAAKALKISTNTVHTYRSRVTEKLGCPTMAGAVAKALRIGFIA